MIKRRIFVPCLVMVVFIVACDEEQQATPASTVVNITKDPGSTGVTEVSPALSSTSETPTLEPTSIPPTLTPAEPLAALVNDRPIFLIEFERELTRYEQAQHELGLESSDVATHQLVLDALIERELIAQASVGLGIAITEDMVQSRLLDLEQTSGGPENLAAWLEANQFSMEEFLIALEAEMQAEMAIELITNGVPTEVGQVHARYLQVDDEALAQSILEQIQNGADFSAMAQQYSLDRMTGEVGGDLGYFALGSLLVPEVEIAAFSLQPGEISVVVPGTRADGTGELFYIIEVIERDPQRRLTADLRSRLLQETFESWLEEQWLMASITRFIDANG